MHMVGKYKVHIRGVVLIDILLNYFDIAYLTYLPNSNAYLITSNAYLLV